MNYKNDADHKRGFKMLVDIFQLIFFILIGFCTVYTLILTHRQNNLIFKPVIGITDVKTTRFFEKQDKYENVTFVKIQFVIQNVGTLPAKNVKIKTIGKLGDTILPYKEKGDEEGVTVIQNAKLSNEATIGRDVIKKLVERGERLIYTIELSYSDWEIYKQYSYPSYFEVYLMQKEPLNLGVKLISQK